MHGPGRAGYRDDELIAGCILVILNQIQGPNATKIEKNLLHCARQKRQSCSLGFGAFGSASRRNTIPVGHEDLGSCMKKKNKKKAKETKNVTVGKNNAILFLSIYHFPHRLLLITTGGCRTHHSPGETD